MTHATIERIRQATQRVADVLRERDELHARLEERQAGTRNERQEAAVLKARIEELERENEVLRSSRPASAAPGTAGTTERIDDLVHEIDRCLALLEDR